MLSDKKLEQKYIDSLNPCASDTDKLWERISIAGEDEVSDITPFETAYEQCVQKQHRSNYLKALRIIAAAAAASALLFILPYALRSANYDYIGLQSSDSADNNTIAEDENFYDAYEDYDSDDSANNVEVYASDGWDYSGIGYTSEIVNYKTLSLAESNGEIYNARASADEDEEYFVQAAVLSDTELFIDGRVISAVQTNDGGIFYEISVIHLISDSISEINQEINVYSDSPYRLLENREYLLPMRMDSDGYEIVFDNAPQIEFTLDRELLYHNGWTALSENCNTVIGYPQTYIDDYFYDRMNLTAEYSLESLFAEWKRIRSIN